MWKGTHALYAVLSVQTVHSTPHVHSSRVPQHGCDRDGYSVSCTSGAMRWLGAAAGSLKAIKLLICLSGDRNRLGGARAHLDQVTVGEAAVARLTVALHPASSTAAPHVVALLARAVSQHVSVKELLQLGQAQP